MRADFKEKAMQALTPQLPYYPSEVLSKLETAERRLELQNAYIAQTQVLLDMTLHLNTLA